MKQKSPWSWIPTLYFAEGLPYIAVMTLAAIMYKNLGLSNSDIALYTAWFNLPWIFKALWSPFVDVLKTKRWWILFTQFFVATVLACVAFSITTNYWFQISFALLFLLAFSSATHDIAADGFYLIVLPIDKQAAFIGIRNTFYRIAMVAGQGGLVMLAGIWEKSLNNKHLAWSLIFAVTSGTMLIVAIYHFFILPRKTNDIQQTTSNISEIFKGYADAFVSFFTKMPLKELLAALFFILAYRFAEAQIITIGKLFMLDPLEKGGLGLTTEQVGQLYGVVGVIALLFGGILGGIAISRNGLKFWLLPMAIAISLTDIVYVYFAYALPDSLIIINICIFIEQFGYGFGFAAFMMYLVYVADGKFKTAHYAFCTGLMALGVMLPQMIAGKLQEFLGYKHFFIWVMISCTLTFVAIFLIKVDKNFGKK